MSHADMNNCCGFNEAAAAFSWNSPKKAINPYLDPAEVAPVSALSNLIALYAADNEQEHLRREALSDQVWERYFFNESRDPVQREMEQDKLISRAKLAHEQQRFNPDMVILADVNAQPSHISKPLMQRIEYFSSLGRPKAYSRYLRETIKPCLERLEHVRDSQLSASFRFMASHVGLDGLLILPEMSQDQVKRLSTLVAAHMSMCLDAACGDLYATDDVKPEEIRKTWEKVAAETLRLDVIPPAFEQLRRKRNRRKPVPYELIPGSLARMLCADWWYRKLWKMRCEWREEQLRAVCLVSKKASPYVSYEAVMHKREQRRKSLEFFRSHELVNEDGDTLDMEDVVNASSSNPAHRRNEMMACVKGLELIAEMRSDCAVFYTITCPSRFHSTLNNGRPNPTWTNATVTRTSSALSWLAGAPLALLRRGLTSSGNAAGLLTAPLSSLRRTASLTGNVLKTVAGAPVALLRSGLSGLRAVAVMFMNPLAVLRGGLAAAGTVLRVLASGPLAMLRVALYAVSGLLGALLSPIGLVVTALAGVALVVWKYWQPITAFLGGVVEGFKAAAGPVSAAFEPLKPVFQWIGDKVQALWGWFTDLLTPVKSTSAELQSAAAMGRRFGEALAEGLNMVMHPLDSLKSGVSWLLEKLGVVSKEAAKAKLPESVTRQQPATVNTDGKVMMPSGGFPSWGYGFAGMYDSGGYIPRGQFGIVGENGPEIVNGPANVTSRRNTAALAAVVAGMMGVAAAPAELPPLHPLALPAKGGEAIVSRTATVPPVYRIEAPTQIIIQTQPGQSAQDIAREVARQLDERERRLKAKARSNYSDQGGYDA